MKNWFWILGWSLSVLTMTGNGLVMFIVCRKQRLRTKTNAFIVSLAVADFFVGLTVVPSLFFCDMASGCDSHGPPFDVIHSLRWLFQYASAANLCTLVLDRFIAVAKPLKYLTFMKRRRVIQMVLISWAVPVTIIVIIVTSPWFNLKTIATHTIGWLCLVLEFLLCAIIIFCFASMLRVVLKHKRSARILAKQLRFNHQVFFKTHERPTVKMMAIVVGLFLFCYGLFLRCSVVLILNDHKPCKDLEYKIPVVLLNSAVNPLVYAIFKKDIKNEFKRLLPKCN